MLLPFERALLGLLPVLSLLAALLWLDSYKLVRLRAVLGVVACGALAATLAYASSSAFLDRWAVPFTTYSRYFAPAIEEVLKALIIVALVRFHRVGFLVDAAIFGFAAGAGFALAENLHYLRAVPDATLGTWLVRGFGTALMHGSATAIFGVMGVASIERSTGSVSRAFLPGLALAIGLHALFNQLITLPRATTLAIVAVFPPLFYAVFQLSSRALSGWLGKGFDSDTAMLGLIESGRFADSPTGLYVQTLRQKFAGPVMADLLCYLRLHTELSIRAKGILMMRESGFEVRIDEAAREACGELRYLEKSIGRTGLLALQPILAMGQRDLWQLYIVDG
jgi:RsiW-degrading membrane proteinase PrsW (M82 family)